MAEKKIRKRPSRSPSIGDMRDRIRIYVRNITSPIFDTASFTEQYTLLDTVWSVVYEITTQGGGISFFVLVNRQNARSTHVFGIRYRSDVDAENRLTHNGYIYKIDKVRDPEKRRRFLFLECTELGEENIEANR